MKNDKKTKISYDPESDVLRVEISKQPIDYAKEMGDFIVHFNRNGLPVYLEVLKARKFLVRTERILEKSRIPEFAGRVT